MSVTDKEIKKKLDLKNQNLTAVQEIVFNNRHLPRHEVEEKVKEHLRKVKASNKESPKEEVEEIGFERKERQREIWGGAVAVTFVYYFLMAWLNPLPDVDTTWGSWDQFTFAFGAMLVTSLVAGITALISRLFTRLWGIVFAVVSGILLSLDLLTRILKYVGYWE